VGKPFKLEELLEVIGKHLNIQYIYSQDQFKNLNFYNPYSDSEQMQFISSIEALETMPNEWIEELYKAAQACSDLLILELIDHIPSENKILVDTLKELVNNFRYDYIMELAKPQMVVQSSS
jgi:hypothetical protein